MSKKVTRGLAVAATAVTLMGSLFGFVGCGNQKQATPPSNQTEMSQEMQGMIEQLQQNQQTQKDLREQIHQLTQQLDELNDQIVNQPEFESQRDQLLKQIEQLQAQKDALVDAHEELLGQLDNQNSQFEEQYNELKQQYQAQLDQLAAQYQEDLTAAQEQLLKDYVQKSQQLLEAQKEAEAQKAELEEQNSKLQTQLEGWRSAPTSLAEAKMVLAADLNNLANYSGIQVEEEVTKTVNDMWATPETLTDAVEQRDGLFAALDLYKLSSSEQNMGYVYQAGKSAAIACAASAASHLLEDGDFCKVTIGRDSDNLIDEAIVNVDAGIQFSQSDFNNGHVTEVELNSNGLETDRVTMFGNEARQASMSTFLKNLNALVIEGATVSYSHENDSISFALNDGTYTFGFNGQTLQSSVAEMNSEAVQYTHTETYTALTQEEFVDAFQQMRAEAEKAKSEEMEN